MRKVGDQSCNLIFSPNLKACYRTLDTCTRQKNQYWPKQAKITCSLCQKVHLLEKSTPPPNMSYAHAHIKSTPTYTFIITAYSRPCLRFHSCGSKMFSKTNPSPGRTSLVPSISVSTNFSDTSDFVNFDTVCIFHLETLLRSDALKHMDK